MRAKVVRVSSNSQVPQIWVELTPPVGGILGTAVHFKDVTGKVKVGTTGELNPIPKGWYIFKVDTKEK